MFKFATTLVLAGLAAAPAFAASAGQPLDFRRDGVHFVGRIVDAPSGVRRITGHEVETGRAFALDVFNGRVTGRYDGEAVSYPVPASALSSGFVAAPAAGGN